MYCAKTPLTPALCRFSCANWWVLQGAKSGALVALFLFLMLFLVAPIFLYWRIGENETAGVFDPAHPGFDPEDFEGLSTAAALLRRRRRRSLALIVVESKPKKVRRIFKNKDVRV